MKKIYLSLIIIFALSASAVAQHQSYRQFRHSQSKSGFKSLGLGLGVYLPSLDYYKDQTGYDFGIAPTASVFAEFWLFKPVAVRVGGSYATTSATQAGTGTFSEETTLTFLPLTVDALFYALPQRRFSRAPSLNYYAGLGADLAQISVKYKSPTSSQSLSGQATFIHVIVGAQYPMTSNLSLGGELQYVLGDYSQGFLLDNGSEVTQKVSTAGPKVLVTLSYSF